jgi:hypothetical protein
MLSDIENWIGSLLSCMRVDDHRNDITEVDERGGGRKGRESGNHGGFVDKQRLHWVAQGRFARPQME